MEEVHASLLTVYDSFKYSYNNFLIQIVPLSVFQKSFNYCLLIEIFEDYKFTAASVTAKTANFMSIEYYCVYGICFNTHSPTHFYN